MDSQQNYQLLKAHRTPEGLYLVFKRAFSTCDPKDYLIEVLQHLAMGRGEVPAQYFSCSQDGLDSERCAIQVASVIGITYH